MFLRKNLCLLVVICLTFSVILDIAALWLPWRRFCHLIKVLKCLLKCLEVRLFLLNVTRATGDCKLLLQLGIGWLLLVLGRVLPLLISLLFAFESFHQWFEFLLEWNRLLARQGFIAVIKVREIL
jgi:hypothetical protein